MPINDEIISLSKEILDDAELGRTSAEALVFKASRLARLVKNESMQTWLSLERNGYGDREPDLSYMAYTGRTYDRKTRSGFWGSIAVQEATIESLESQMDVVRSFKPSGEYSTLQFHTQQQQAALLATKIANLKRIRSKVVAGIQEFSTNIYYEKLFSGKASDIFSQYSEQIDALLADQVGKVVAMLPSVFERLKSNEPEAVNQALLSCRRILDAFINKLYPPSDSSVTVDGEVLDVGVEMTKNRFKAYICERTRSASVKDKLWKDIRLLYDRTSTAVHDNVTQEEAQALVLRLYVTLGEILTLGTIPKAAVPNDNPSE